MSRPNAFLSNGTCYQAPGREAAREMIPCGNDALGHKTCCQQDDMCLSSNACYNQPNGVTYLSGCSDPNYEDDSCPDKGAFSNLPWTGLVYCNGTSNQWVACEQDAKPSILTKADFCFCPETSRTVAFTDASILTNVVKLPATAGGSVIWQPGFAPTDSPTGGNTSLPTNTGGPGPTNTSPGSPGSSQTDPDSSGSNLSRGAKIGIGVGVGVAGAIILALLAIIFAMRRRRDRKEDVVDSKVAESSPGNAAIMPGTPATPAFSELDSRPARPWSTRSELQTADTPVSLAEREEIAAAEAIKAAEGTQATPAEHPAALHPGPRPGGNAQLSSVPERPVAELP